MTNSPTVTITVDIDGEAHPISECAWLRFAPCGCLSGIMTTRDYERNGWITSTEDAARQFTENKDMREHEQKLGFTIRLGTKAETAAIKTPCQHVPQWGYEKTPIPDGHLWGHPEKARRRHLYAEGQNSTYSQHWAYRATSICGTEHKSVDMHPAFVRDYMECQKCATRAKETTDAE